MKTTNKQVFISEIDNFMSSFDNINPQAIAYWNELKKTIDKPMSLTDTGKVIIAFLQNCGDSDKAFRAKDIGEELFISSRTISGAMRKLIADELVEKVGQDPVQYKLTQIGQNITIN